MCGEIMHIFYLIVVSCNVGKTVSNSFNFHFISAFLWIVLPSVWIFIFRLFWNFSVSVVCWFLYSFKSYFVIYPLSCLLYASCLLFILQKFVFFCVADAVPIKNMIHVKGQTVFKTVSCQYVMWNKCDKCHRRTCVLSDDKYYYSSAW